jgi:hypothetical protein
VPGSRHLSKSPASSEARRELRLRRFRKLTLTEQELR